MAKKVAARNREPLNLRPSEVERLRTYAGLAMQALAPLYCEGDQNRSLPESEYAMSLAKAAFNIAEAMMAEEAARPIRTPRVTG